MFIETRKTYDFHTKEYQNLLKAAHLMSLMTNKDLGTFYVNDTYLDFGQGWMWTTISRKGGEWGPVQVLCPRDHKAIILADNYEELKDAVVRSLTDNHYI